MPQLHSKTEFCKSRRKLVKQMVYVFLAVIIISNIKFLFTEDELSYLTHLFIDLFRGLFFLLVWIIFDMFETDCIHYDEVQFHIDKSGIRSRQESFRFDDIVKINYKPYLRLLTIKMKQENSYVDLSPDNYAFKDFEQFLRVLESHKPISKGFYIPTDGIKSPTGFIIAGLITAIFLSLIVLGIYVQVVT
jgi:hypothetical protein